MANEFVGLLAAFMSIGANGAVSSLWPPASDGPTLFLMAKLMRELHSGTPVTNIRNTTSPHWRGWLKPENRCLVPFNSFAEYAPEPNPETKKKDVVWFAINDDRPPTCFGGIWTEFKGDRGTKSKPIPGPRQ